ncbi:MAG: ABC transporter permease [Thalassolituus sp.]|nr:MAG: ABC transporter permease [Thalassolituus sp.]
MKKNLFKPLVMGALLVGTLSVEAHRAWVVPQETQLAGEGRWVAFDAAVSNDIFVANHAAGRFDDLVVLKPDGNTGKIDNLHKGKNRTVFDVELDKEGTYKIFVASTGLRAMWEEDGKRRMYPGRGEQYTGEGFAENVPAKADKLSVIQASRRMETFVTLGATTDGTLKPTGEGLEMVPVTHPNDLYAGEKATFRFLIDGKPAKGAELTAIREGTRYRNSQDEITAVADKKGDVSISWNGAGRYFVEVEYQDDKARKPATERRGTYITVLEVLPD